MSYGPVSFLPCARLVSHSGEVHVYATWSGVGSCGGCQEPSDAFFGARYAAVRDPGGNDVGLMSPIDQHRRFAPKA
jgi:hypothetical protein